MNAYQEKSAYLAMPVQYQKHGTTPTMWEMQDDLEAYYRARRAIGVNPII